MSQLSFEITKRGGKRRNAGRKKLLASEPAHKKREKITRHLPGHATLKFRAGVPSLRTLRGEKTVKRAIRCAAEFGLRVIEYSIQQDHLHLLIEAESNDALTRGMISLKTSIAKALKVGGSIFRGRYHLHVLKTPTEIRNAINYVVYNRAKHMKVKPFIDRFSSAHPDGMFEAGLTSAYSWLLRTAFERLWRETVRKYTKDFADD